jgi:hypothetical protein
MKTGASRLFQRSLLVAAAGILALMLAACTGRGGGQLPPQSPTFNAAASFGFTFSCQDSGGLNPPTGQLKIELSYTDKGSNPIGSSFGIHGIVDRVDPRVESALCIGKNPAPGGALIFLGRYRLTSGSPSSLSKCPTRETTTSPMCRFEVDVQDNDRSMTPSKGDTFKIMLSNAPVTCPGSTLEQVAPCSQLPAGSVIYTRGGKLSSGNLTVD